MKFGAWIDQMIKDQMAEHVHVIPVAKYSEKENCFYINSIAGLLKYKPKNLKDLTRFRDKWINKFEQTCRGYPWDKAPSDDAVKRLFKFYEEIRAEEKIKYTANLRTRLKGVKWSLKI